MDAWYSLSDVRGQVDGVHGMKEGEEIIQRTYMHIPCTQTTMWWGPEGGENGY